MNSEHIECVVVIFTVLLFVFTFMLLLLLESECPFYNIIVCNFDRMCYEF